jgi:hypothetical protein
MSDPIILIDPDTRRWRRMAHRIIDPQLRGKERRTRRAFFGWLAEEMGLPLEQARISRMDADQCRLAIKICKERMQ